MTIQEMFDKIYTWHVIEGNPRSVNPDYDKRNLDAGPECLYRGPNGEKCAAGVLIPDELYGPKMEDWVGAHELAEKFPQLRGILPDPDTSEADFLTNMQTAHDRAYDSVGLEERYLSLAARYNLTIPGREE